MSEIVTIMEFNFLKPINPCSGKAKVWSLAWKLQDSVNNKGCLQH